MPQDAAAGPPDSPASGPLAAGQGCVEVAITSSHVWQIAPA